MNKKNGNKGLIVIILILVVILLVMLGYIINDKYSTKDGSKPLKDSKEQTILIEGNTFDLNGTTCVKDGNSCVKEIEVSYNGKNHDVKLKQELVEEKENTDEYDIYYQGKYYLYVDNKLIDTLDIGQVKVSKTGDERPELVAKLYIFDGKYLGLLREISYLESSSGYELTLYNGKTKIGNDVVVKIPGQGLCYDSECKKEINVIDEIEFDGNAFKFYQIDCDSNKIVLYSLTTDGTKIERTIDKKVDTDGIFGGGSSGCFSQTKNKISY